MLKRLAFIAVLLVVVATSVFAQAKNGGIAREIALGGSNPGPNLVINPFVFDDPTVMLLNPAFISKYRDYAWMNVAGGGINNFAATDDGYGKQFAGVNFAFGKELTVGMVLSYDPSASPLLRGGLNTFIGLVGRRTPNPTGLANPGPVEVFTVVAAYKIGGIDLGFGVTYGWTNSQAKSSTTVANAATESFLSASLFGLQAGALIDLSGGTFLDVSAAFRMDKAKDNVKYNTIGEDNYSISATELNLNARFKMKMSNRFNLIPYATFANISGEPKEDNVPTGATAVTGSVKNSAMALAVGIGGELKTSNFYLAGGVTYAMTTVKTETTPGGGVGTTTATVAPSSTSFPVFNLGTEFWFTDWLAGRMGYYRAFSSAYTKNEPPSPGFTTETWVFAGSSFYGFGVGSYASDNLVTLGLGLKFSGFALDATVSEQALRRGLGLLGAQDNMNTFGYVSLSYCFE